ncbi:MAG: cob(I)yrinic acid a,c-diamide adenosyltransferase [Kiritimatiellaeota bacterium]|nr:cob(I)yrinic acid a,c-diamide adenosyltransferase [Kiritimatiellota bacterium]
MKRSYSITTRIGDRGTTRTLFGETLPKSAPRIEACGQVDELVSALGLARAHAARGSALDAQLQHLQRTLFAFAAEISAGPIHAASLPQRLDAKAVAPMRDFIIPGENLLGAHLDFARTVSRRCERAVVTLADRKAFRNRHAFVWLNRLSDVLWLLARQAEGHSRPLHEKRP